MESNSSITKESCYIRAIKKYRASHREIINEKAREKYHLDSEYKERRRKQMIEYSRKRRELKKELEN